MLRSISLRVVSIVAFHLVGSACAASDLASLLPGGALAYAELSQPGAHLARIVEAAGLTRRGDKAQPFFVSPRLLEALKSVEGAAFALTDFDARHGVPRGVLVLDPGKADLVYGLVETALSGGAAAGELRLAEPLEGNSTYEAPEVVVSLTERLIIAGSSRELVAQAIQRSKASPGSPLAVDPVLKEAHAQGGDSLLSVYVNAKPVLERLKAEAFHGGEPPQEYRIAQALADVESIRWAAFHLGTSGNVISADLRLQLDDANNAFAYHLLRTPRVSESALRAVPAEAVAFLAFALGDSEGKAVAAPVDPSRPPEPITGLDFGREVFANIKDVAAFVLPWAPAAAKESRRPPIPDAALVLTVRDAARSDALWKQLLSLVSLAAPSKVKPVRTDRIEGCEVRVYELDRQLQLHFAALKDRVVVATSSAAAAKAIATTAGRGSASEDPELKQAVAAAGKAPSKLAVVHAGRLWRMLQPMVGLGDEEAKAVEAFTRAISLAAKAFMENPMGSPLIPNWSRVTSAIPGILGMLKKAVDEDNR